MRAVVRESLGRPDLDRPDLNRMEPFEEQAYEESLKFKEVGCTFASFLQAIGVIVLLVLSSNGLIAPLLAIPLALALIVGTVVAGKFILKFNRRRRGLW